MLEYRVTWIDGRSSSPAVFTDRASAVGDARDAIAHNCTVLMEMREVSEWIPVDLADIDV